MKKKYLLIALFYISLYGLLDATTVTIVNVNTTFSPNEVHINPGDTIIFSIGSTHNVVEVSEETWNANGSTSNGGFTLDFGGGELVLNTSGTYYYVCEPHASLGMKGKIVVAIVTAVSEIGKSGEFFLKAYPNPLSDQLSLEFNISEFTSLQIELLDITGRRVLNLINNEYSPGNYTEALDIGDLKPGKYFIHYVTKSDSKVKSLLKL